MERIEGRIEDQAGRLEYLLHFLRDENPRCSGMELPDDEEGRRRLLRALMNVRPPWPIGGDFLEVQDAYLREETRKKGIVDAEALSVAAEEPGASSLAVWRGDITTLRVDAVVNAANASLLGCFVPGHGCIDNVIHTYAGVQLRLECDTLMRRQGHEEPTGGAKITGAYNLPSRHVVHTVGPIVADRRGGTAPCSPTAIAPAWSLRARTGLSASRSAASPRESSVFRSRRPRRSRWRPSGGSCGNMGRG